jgi:hypothetical protein
MMDVEDTQCMYCVYLTVLTILYIEELCWSQFGISCSLACSFARPPTNCRVVKVQHI